LFFKVFLLSVLFIGIPYQPNGRTHLPPTLRGTELWITTCFDAGQGIAENAELLAVR
jgi:hypothetical protein